MVYFCENLCLFLKLEFSGSSLFFAMLCLDGHKMPKNLSKPLVCSALLFSRETTFWTYFQKSDFCDKPIVLHLLKKGLLATLAENSEPKKITLTGAQKIA